MLSANQFAPIRSSNTAAPRHIVNSTALEKSHILKAEPGYLTDLMVYNNSASTRYVLVFDSITLPADGVAPTVIPIPISAGTAMKLDGFVTAMPFGTGITVCLSTTAATKTLVGSNEAWFTAIVL